MATKNFRSTVLEPTSEFAHGDKLRFTALATVGEVLKGSFSETTIGEDGVYSVDLQYGKHRIDYKPYEGVWRHFADVEVNADTLATTLQDLALASVPVTDEAVLVLQGILADAEAAKTAAETAETAAETALASIDSTVADVAAGYPSLLAAQLSKSVTVNATTGDDTTADGSSAKPFKTIKAAIESQIDATRIAITLAGGTSKATAHVIDSTISAMSKKISINLAGNHLILSDSVANVFTSNEGCTIGIDDVSGGGVIYATSPKVMLLATGESLLSIASYTSVVMHLSDAASMTFIKPRYLGIRGVSRVTASRINLKSADGESATNAAIYAAEVDNAGTALVNLWSCSLGNNFNFTKHPASHLLITGNLVAVSA